MLVQNNYGLPEPTANTSDCPELADEVNVLRSELTLLIAEIQKYSRGLRKYAEPLSDVADSLDAILRGD